MMIISIKNLTKVYGRKAAVNNINLSLRGGEIFALLGPNGSGKSTILKMLVGIIKPTSGDAVILEKSVVSDIDNIKKSIGVLPETLGLFDGLSIWEHLLLAGNVYDISKVETAFRAEQLLKHLDLWQSKNTKIELSSFGMKKKCAFGMAILHAPEIVFLDEPFEGIDPLSARNIKKICRLLKRRGTTVFITSHQVSIMEEIADSFAVISDGGILCHREVGDVRREGTSVKKIYFKLVGETTNGDMSWLEN